MRVKNEHIKLALAGKESEIPKEVREMAIKRVKSMKPKQKEKRSFFSSKEVEKDGN